MTAQRIQLRRAKGWRKPAEAVVVARPTKWGNPYRAIRGTMYGPPRSIEGGDLVAYSTHGPAAGAVLAAVEAYERDIDCSIRSKLTTEAIRQELRGKDLACWCPLDQPCHADVLLEIANGSAS